MSRSRITKVLLQPPFYSKSKKNDSVALVAVKPKRIKKRRRISEGDRRFNLKRPRLNAAPNIDGLLNIRCDKKRYIVNDQGVHESLRTTVMLNTSAANTCDVLFSPRKVNAALLREMEKNKPASFGRIVGIEERSEYGSPTKVKIISPTKGSNKVYLASRDSTPGSSLSTYTTRNLNLDDAVEKIEFLAGDHTFFNSEAYQKIEKYFQSVKQHEVTLRKQSNKYAKSFFSQPNQQTLMKGKAKDYAAATGLFVEGMDWEWLHEVGRLFARFLDKPQWTEMNGLQSVDNLIAGTAYANTEMLLVENAIMKSLIKQYPQGFSLRVKANLMEKKDVSVAKEYLHIGWQLEYDIIAPDFTLSKIFNLQIMNQPHIDYKNYVEAELKVLMNLNQQQGNQEVLMPEKESDGYELYSHCYQSKR